MPDVVFFPQMMISRSDTCGMCGELECTCLRGPLSTEIRSTMKIVHIKNKLEQLGVPLSSINLGRFDEIGEFAARKKRNSDDPLYHSVGAFFRPQYERAIFIYYLIRQHNIKSYLEVGFGRGMSTFAACMAFHDMGVMGANKVVTTIDPNLNEQHLAHIMQQVPREWYDLIDFRCGTSQEVIPTLTNVLDVAQPRTFDMIYVDGDHSYEGTALDWRLCKELSPRICLFDDYHLPTKQDAGIQCTRAIDEVEWAKEGFCQPEMIRMDRRIFLDDRGFTDEQIDYGQVLCVKEGVTPVGVW
jgi:predicted O-methyltransferase YrrM